MYLEMQFQRAQVLHISFSRRWEVLFPCKLACWGRAAGLAGNGTARQWAAVGQLTPMEGKVLPLRFREPRSAATIKE